MQRREPPCNEPNERTVYDLLRLNEDPDLVDRSYKTRLAKQLHKFDLDRMSMSYPLWQRASASLEEMGKPFASSLITRKRICNPNIQNARKFPVQNKRISPSVNY